MSIDRASVNSEEATSIVSMCPGDLEDLVLDDDTETGIDPDQVSTDLIDEIVDNGDFDDSPPPVVNDHFDFRIVDLSNPLNHIHIEPEAEAPDSLSSIRPESMAELVDKMRISNGDLSTISDDLLKRRMKDFQHAQKQRRKRYSFQPFGIAGLFVNLSDIRSDLRWAEDAAIRRVEGLPYISWKDFEKARQRGKNRPFFTYTMLLAFSVMMLLAFHWNHWKIEPLSVNPLMGPSPEVLLLLGALQMKEMLETGSWWRLVTSMFLHGGIIHVVLNAIVLGLMGRAIERNHGSAMTTILYFTSGVGGNIISCLMQPGYILVGASGGIFGLIGVCVADVALNWKLLFLAFRDKNSKPANWWIRLCSMFWLICDLVINSLIGFTPFVDNFAHLGGLVYGFLISLTILQRLPLSFFGSGSGLCHRIRIGTFRVGGAVLAVALFCITAILLSDSDGLKSPCHKCRYISCLPFPFWTTGKWWYCDGCDAATGKVFRRNDTNPDLFTDLDLFCPLDVVVEVDIAEDGITDPSYFDSSLSGYCRSHCGL